MYRTVFSRARGVAQSRVKVRTAIYTTAVARPAHTEQATTKPADLDSLLNTPFSPMNPGVTVFRPLPCKEQLQEQEQNPAPVPPPTTDALLTTYTSYSPANPGATHPLLASAFTVSLPHTTATTSNHSCTALFESGSRLCVLEHIPTFLKRFDMSKTNVLTRQEASSSSSPSASHPVKDIVSKTETTTTPRPWSFKLPGFLRPREGTTYYDTLKLEVADEKDGCVKTEPNVLQYILYGKPDPDGDVVVMKGKMEMPVDTEGIVNGKDLEKIKGVAAKKVEEVKTVEVYDGADYGIMAK